MHEPTEKEKALVVPIPELSPEKKEEIRLKVRTKMESLFGETKKEAQLAQLEEEAKRNGVDFSKLPESKIDELIAPFRGEEKKDV